jgi:hypothetical protein
LKRPATGSSIVVGAYKGNIDSNNKNQRVFSANIPRSHYENYRNNNIEKIQFNTAELQLIKQLSQLQPSNSNNNNINTSLNSINSNTSLNSIPSVTSNGSNNIKNINNIHQQPKEIVFEKVGQLYKESTSVKSAFQKPELKTQNFDKFENFHNRSLESFDINSHVIQGSQQRPLKTEKQAQQQEQLSRLFETQKKPLQTQHQQEQLQKIFLEQAELQNQQQQSQKLQHLHQQTQLQLQQNKEQQLLTKYIFTGESPSATEKSTSSYNFNEPSSTSNNSIDNFDNRSMTSTRKNVSFNSAIDIRTYPKNVPKYLTTSKNINDFLYTEDKQLAINFNDEINHKEKLANEDQSNGNKSILSGNSTTGNEIHDQIIESLSKTLISGSENSNKIADELANLINSFNFPKNEDNTNTVKANSDNNTKSSNENNNSYNKNSIIERSTVSSKKKLPGETPVRDLEKTLKMIIIKELSVEKVDGMLTFQNFKIYYLFIILENDWKMFAKRVGMSDADIKEWISLRLQFPMARVLSVWSSKPEATVRLLHRHLNAPCFNYKLLAKRIETFYDVL